MWNFISRSICNTLFLGKPVGGELTTTPEALEAGFFPVDQALEMVTWGNFHQRIAYCLKEEEQPFYVSF